jgi:hypothetical protein
VSNSTFWLTEKNGAKVPGRALSASAIAIFVPHEQLKPDTDYIAYLSKSIKSKDGKPLYADVKWEFTTRNTSGSSVMSNTSLDLSLAKQLQPIQGGTFVIPQLNITMPGQTNQTQPSQNQSTPQPQQNVSQQTNPQQSPAQTQQSPPPESLTQPQSDPNLDMEKINAPDSSIMNQSPSEKPEYIDPSGEATKSGQPSTPGEEISINPQPEPPKPAGLFDSIVNFFKSLFGWK